MSYIYLDHAAATPILPEVKEVLFNLDDDLGNPSSVHQPGSQSRMLIDAARQLVANFFEVSVGEVIFTSGATESLYLGIIGSYLAKEKKSGIIYISPITHSAISGAVEFLVKNFSVEVKYLPITKEGIIDENKFDSILEDSPDIIVCECGNSEIGILQPVARIGKKCLKYAQENKTEKPIFIVDAAAAIVSEKVSLEYQKCDLIAVSGEKIGALPGIGVLIKKQDLPLSPLQKGSHEFGFRGGTENLWGIISLSKALEVLERNREENVKKYEIFQTEIRNFFTKNFSKIKITTPESREVCLPHVFHFLLPTQHAKAALFVIQSDMQGLAISAGSACSSGSIGGSKALEALGFEDAEIFRGIRLSFGWSTKKKDIEKALDILKTLI